MSIKGVLIVLTLVTALPAVLSVTFTEYFKGAHLYYTVRGVYSFSPMGLEGQKVNLSQFAGQPLLFVNIPYQIDPSRVSALNQLKDYYSEIKLEVLAFPTDEFSLSKDFDKSFDIKKWIKDNSIKFHVFDPVHVNGENSEPLWMFLKSFFKFHDNEITEDYTLFLVDLYGFPAKRFSGSWDSFQAISYDLHDFFGMPK